MKDNNKGNGPKQANPEEGNFIFRMTITLKNGKVIRRANGRPFKIPVK